MVTAVRSAFSCWFSDIGYAELNRVGGKNASLGEMISNLKAQDIRIPDGFAITAEAYRLFLRHNHLENKIVLLLESMHQGKSNLPTTGKAIRRLIEEGSFPRELEEEIILCYRQLSRKYDVQDTDVAVRSSATAEDLPDASFAGQQETFLNVCGSEALLKACKQCYASLFTDRAICYREEKGFDHMEAALSVGIQKMVRSDQGCSGVMFTLDTETGFPDVVLINAAWGLGESIVQGIVNPDEFLIYKPFLDRHETCPIIEKKLGSKEVKIVYSAENNGRSIQQINATLAEQTQFALSYQEVLTLARWGKIIEEHYRKPMDIEWAKDGLDGQLYVVQARPETVHSRKERGFIESFRMKEKGEVLAHGVSIGSAIASGQAKRLKSIEEGDSFNDGDILVTEMTDPNWVPLMKKAAGIVTNQGGRTCHAAIISREFGIPAIVGTTNATEKLADNQSITVSCAEGNEGFVYEGKLDFEIEKESVTNLPDIKTKLMLNIASPAAAFRWWQLPVKGIGLARMEFIINNIIQIHPMALVHYEHLKDTETREKIDKLTMGYPNKTDYFVDKLCQGLAKIAASVYPHPAIVRMSDFKTNEYADLIGGKEFESGEANPMLGFRGASRYQHEHYKEGFLLECKALRRAREVLGFDNIIAMIPFCRTLSEADGVLALMAEHGLSRNKNRLKIYMMCEVPSNVILAEEFMERFDGFSIGSNDLTQLILGVDRDSSILSDVFNENEPAVKKAIQHVLSLSKSKKFKVGICGQAPSDYPDFAAFLVENGIDSISLNPDSVLTVHRKLAAIERCI